MSDDLLEPYQPSAGDPFDLAKAGHLARRAGLGASLRRREDLVRMGPARAVESCFLPGEGEDVDALASVALVGDDVERVRAYRGWRLLAGRVRLRERMSLFWHAHFATSIEKVLDAGAMARQLRLFDEFGLGRFEVLCAGVLRDPAMLRWLDGDRNLKGRPNENLARELLELFALGRGGYGEHDVQEAARALTGWIVDQGASRFVLHRHDEGDKAIFGQQGNFGLDELVATTVSRPACARHLARKLLACFVHPEPLEQEIDAIAARWQDAGGDVGAVMRVLLRSRLFFSPRARRSRVSDPLEFVIGLVRVLGAHASPRELVAAASKLGQTLLAPPSVEGWPADRAWLSSSAWLLRANFVMGLLSEPGFALEPGCAAILGKGTPSERIELAIRIIFDGELPTSSRAALAHWLDTVGSPGAAEILHAVMLLPEAQLQ